MAKFIKGLKYRFASTPPRGVWVANHGEEITNNVFNGIYECREDCGSYSVKLYPLTFIGKQINQDGGIWFNSQETECMVASCQKSKEL